MLGCLAPVSAVIKNATDKVTMPVRPKRRCQGRRKRGNESVPGRAEGAAIPGVIDRGWIIAVQRAVRLLNRETSDSMLDLGFD